MGRVTRPHLRNLLWRTLRLLDAGVLPLFVLEGDAPSLKWNTINKRNQQNFGHGRGSASATVKTGKRSQFKTIQKECAHLLDLLGVPWVQAVGEAEATCAALNYHQVVSGVITQDSDVFLYGGETVFRNFSANQSKATVEKFCMPGIEEHLGVNRSGLLVLSLLLGCDYLPAGIPQVGKETAIRMIREWYQQGVNDPLDRVCKWSLKDEDDWRDINPKKWKSGSLLELEAGVRQRALATEGFPFLDIIKEYKSNIRIPKSNFKWRQPQMKELMRWCIIKLDWEPNYALEKMAPVVSRWMMMNISPQKPVPTNYVSEIQAVRCLKKCVRGGVASMVVEWNVVDNEKFQCSIPASVTTDEPVIYIRESAPHLIEQFEEELQAKKKGKSRRKKKPEEILDHGISSTNLNTKVENRKSSRKKKSEDVLEHGMSSINLNTKVENNKSVKREAVKSNTKIKPITHYLQPINKIEDIVKGQKKALEEDNIENSETGNHPLSLQDRATLRLKESIIREEIDLKQTDLKNQEISSSAKVEALPARNISNNEVYNMQSLNDDDLAELSGMLHKLEMIDDQDQSNNILNSKEDEQYFEESESHTTEKNYLDSITGNNESFNNDNDLNDSRNINNISEIINRISEAPILHSDKNKDLHLNKTHFNKKATCIDKQSCPTNSKFQMLQRIETSNFNSMFSKEETHGKNYNKYDINICNTNDSFIEKRVHKSINIQKNMKPTLSSSAKDTVHFKDTDHENSIKDENCYSKELLKNISSEDINVTNLSSDQSNYMEESWQEDDNDFELSMIINRITGMKMENANSCNGENAKAIDASKGFDILKNVDEINNLSGDANSVCLENLETQKKSDYDLKKSSCWQYFTPISERHDIDETLPHKILSSQPRNDTKSLNHTNNSLCEKVNLCNKIGIDIPKEIQKPSEEHLIESLKQQACNVVNAGNMASDIIRCSLKNSSELSAFGNSLSDSIITAAADIMSFDKTENSKNQVSFDLFENSCDSQVNKETTKYSSDCKSKDANKGTTSNLPKHHSTPSIGYIAPRRILNRRSHSNTPKLKKNSLENDLGLPSPLSVSSIAQTSFISDFGSPFSTHSSPDDIVNASFPCPKKDFDTPVSSKATRDETSNHNSSKTSQNKTKSDLILSSNDDHQDRNSKFCTMKYECKRYETPKYKVQEDQLCFKLLDTFNNSSLNISTSVSEIQNDCPSSVELKDSFSPKWAPTDCDSMSIFFPKECLGNVKLERVPEENISSINDKERKPLKGLINTERNVKLFHNNGKRVKEINLQEAEKVDVQKQLNGRKFVNLKTSDTNKENELHIKKGKENKESNMNNIKVFDDNHFTENETNVNSHSKYNEVSTFSPFVPSQYVSLADRLKAKYRDKAMEKLIDQL